MGHIVRKPVWTVQPQKMARCLKFWITKVEGLYYLFSKKKMADQLHMQTAGFLMMRFI